MDKMEYSRKLAKLMKLAMDFPFLCRVVTKWHPDVVDIVVQRANPSDLEFSRDAGKCAVWFWVKCQSNYPYYEMVDVTPKKGTFSLKELKDRFHFMSDELGIEYMVVTWKVDWAKKEVVLIFRPPKGQKDW